MARNNPSTSKFNCEHAFQPGDAYYDFRCLHSLSYRTGKNIGAVFIGDCSMVDLTTHPALRFFNGKGRITQVPAKPDRKAELLDFLQYQFEVGHEYTEKEVNEILKDLYDDYVYLRRLLVESDLLYRNPTGSRYWRPELPDTDATSGL